jgi:5-methylcytosine-specific restriction endonuclease McrA
MTAESVLESRVLVLNSIYQPINVISLKKALCKLVKSVAEVVHVEDGMYNSYSFASWAEVSELRQQIQALGTEDELLGSAGFSFVVPRIIRVLTYSKSRKHPVRLNRKNVFARDRRICQYCGKRYPSEGLNLDHVIPRSQGGKEAWENLVCACFRCNSRKGGRTPLQAGMKLIRLPVRPPAAAVRVTIGDRKYKDWEAFVSDAYWEVDLQE